MADSPNIIKTKTGVVISTPQRPPDTSPQAIKMRRERKNKILRTFQTTKQRLFSSITTQSKEQIARQEVEQIHKTQLKKLIAMLIEKTEEERAEYFDKQTAIINKTRNSDEKEEALYNILLLSSSKFTESWNLKLEKVLTSILPILKEKDFYLKLLVSDIIKNLTIYEKNILRNKFKFSTKDWINKIFRNCSNFDLEDDSYFIINQILASLATVFNQEQAVEAIIPFIKSDGNELNDFINFDEFQDIGEVNNKTKEEIQKDTFLLAVSLEFFSQLIPFLQNEFMISKVTLLFQQFNNLLHNTNVLIRKLTTTVIVNMHLQFGKEMVEHPIKSFPKHLISLINTYIKRAEEK
ncbi:hypothetical protein M0811_00609 [Anaeramoeba ignava]|uniref:Uncharacterized protein n=1 Tax=Anaeramoeba ignava TaxID=1746090 RepID=A0A9Q0L9Q2_ANAIG|nr:hypothetical protein M0811_02661 [Anaeramoeba ignava]KAJ5077289.1 hypothetical protein M0811_00609 [Anaeramoeba ignava]